MGAEGLNPKTELGKRRANARPAAPAPVVPKFREAAVEWCRKHEPEWKNPRYPIQVMQSLFDHVYPARLLGGGSFGETQVDRIDLKAVRVVLDPLWKPIREGGKPNTADKVRQRIEGVLAFAGVNGWRGNPVPQNPAAWTNFLDQVYPPIRKLAPQKNHPMIHPDKAPTFMAELRATEGDVARALEMLVMTTVRTASILEARWEQVDWTWKVWHIPDTKTSVEQWVPLTDDMVACLKRVPVVADEIFRIAKDAMYSLCSRLCDKLKIERATPHGFRATFSSWASKVGQDENLTECALSHVIKTEVARRYDRRTVHHNLLDRRRPLMSDWCDYLAGREPPSNVVELSPAA
jgi:integrase